MTNTEANIERNRLAKYNELFEARKLTYESLCAIRADDPHGPHKQGPFTGNTRESRNVVSLHIKFSTTKGGAPAVDMFIGPLNISAWQFGQSIAAMLEERLKELDKAIEEV